ncbi:hypothetical protein [Antrihabitans spumae]|jgi:hypothetical protein|uniref:Uncharacterized protein n=1 Tax=Antrihabitans spumae TaxID=3373370 RepID=A0ABW7KTX0_9NOCA
MSVKSRHIGRNARRFYIGMCGVGLVGAFTVAVPGIGSAAPALPANCTAAGSTVTCTYEYTGGEQSFAVPADVTSVRVVATGQQGSRAHPKPCFPVGSARSHRAPCPWPLVRRCSS